MDSLRLQKILNLIPEGVGIADIGTDHAQIPISLAVKTNCHPIIAGEKNSGPYKTALASILEAGLEKAIDLRLGSGLTILQPGEVQWAVIAGLGWQTIVQIITEAEGIARSLEGLILQPMQGAAELRYWLTDNSFQLIDEFLIKDDQKLFQIILIKSGEAEVFDEIFYEIGPILFAKRDPYLIEHLKNLIGDKKKILAKIVSDQGERARAKIAELGAKIQRLEEVYAQCQRKCNG